MKLFVTGAAGFIGSNYVRWLLANGDDEVTIFDALTYAGNLESIRDLLDDRRCRFVHADICDQEAVLNGMDCLLYTSDAADERSSVDLGGRRIIKTKTTAQHCKHNEANTENKKA